MTTRDDFIPTATRILGFRPAERSPEYHHLQILLIANALFRVYRQGIRAEQHRNLPARLYHNPVAVFHRLISLPMTEKERHTLFRLANDHAKESLIPGERVFMIQPPAGYEDAVKEAIQREPTEEDLKYYRLCFRAGLMAQDYYVTLRI